MPILECPLRGPGTSNVTIYLYITHHEESEYAIIFPSGYSTRQTKAEVPPLVSIRNGLSHLFYCTKKRSVHYRKSRKSTQGSYTFSLYFESCFFLAYRLKLLISTLTLYTYAHYIHALYAFILQVSTKKRLRSR